MLTFFRIAGSKTFSEEADMPETMMRRRLLCMVLSMAVAVVQPPAQGVMVA